MSEEELSVQGAARRVGLSEFGLRGAIDRGEVALVPGSRPMRLAAAEVERFRRARQDAALERLSAKGTDLRELAGATRAFLQPHPGAPRGSVSTLGADVVAVFGPAALAAAALPEPECGWCASVVAAGLLRVPPPAYGEAMRALLGEPCARDMKRFGAGEMEKLRAKVHPGGVRPAGGRAEASRSWRPVVSAEPVQRAVTAAANPSGAWDERAYMEKRRRQINARLIRAVQAGDTAYAEALRGQFRSL